MGTGDYICVTLRGGAPWGFTLREGEGDTYRPFHVFQVEEGGHAFLAGVRDGDEVVSVNGEPCADLTLSQAFAVIDTSTDCLQLLVKRYCSIIPGDFESEGTYCGERASSGEALESTTLHILSPSHSSQGPRELYISESQEEAYYGEVESDTEVPKEPQLICTQLRVPSSGDPRGLEPLCKEKDEGVRRSFSPGAMVELQVSLSEQTLEDIGCTSLGSAHGIEGLLSNREATKTIQTTRYVPCSVRQPLGQHGVVLSSPSMLGQVEVTLQQPATAGRGILTVAEGAGGLRSSVGSQWEGEEGGGHSKGAPESFTVTLGIPTEEATPTEERDSDSEGDQGKPSKHRARHARLRRSDSLSEKQVKEAKSKCKRIALLLTAAPPNPNNKGVLMFKKHRQRAKKYTLVSYGTGESEPEDEDDEDEDNKQDTHAVEFTLVATSDSELEEHFFNAPGGKGVLTFNWDKGLLEIERKLNNQAEMECLPETKGKGAQMFAQRRQRMDEISAEHEELRRQGIPVEGVQETGKKVEECSYMQAMTEGHAYMDVNMHQQSQQQQQQYQQYQEQQYYEQHQHYQQQQQYQQQYQQQQQYEQQNYQQQTYQQQQEYHEQQQQQIQQYSANVNGIIHHQTNEMQSSFSNRTAKPFSVQNTAPTTYSPTISGTNQDAMAQGEQIASRDERISTPAIRTGLLQDTKRKNTGKPMFTFKEAPKVSPNPALLNLLNRNNKKLGFESGPEEDYLSLGAEACNFLQSPIVKHKTPPPVAPKPVIKPNSPPWSPQIEVTNEDMPQHAENSLSAPAVAPTAETTPAPELEPTPAPAPEPSPLPAPQEAPANTPAEEQHTWTLPEPQPQQQPQQVIAWKENSHTNSPPQPEPAPVSSWASAQTQAQQQSSTSSWAPPQVQPQEPAPSQSPPQPSWMAPQPTQPQAQSQPPMDAWAPPPAQPQVQTLWAQPQEQAQSQTHVQTPWAQPHEEPQPLQVQPTWAQPQQPMQQQPQPPWAHLQTDSQPPPPWAQQLQQKSQTQPPWVQQAQPESQPHLSWVQQPQPQHQAPQQAWPQAQAQGQGQPPWVSSPQPQQQPPSQTQTQSQPPWVQVAQAQPSAQPQASLNPWAPVPAQAQPQPSWAQQPPEHAQPPMNSWGPEQSQAQAQPPWAQPVPTQSQPQTNWQQAPPQQQTPPQAPTNAWPPAQTHPQTPAWAPQSQQPPVKTSGPLMNTRVTQASPKPWHRPQNVPHNQTPPPPPQRINSHTMSQRASSPLINPMASVLNPSSSASAFEMPAVRGKGADLFAKRQSRMEKFVVDSESVQANKASRSTSPAASLPNEWKYSPNVRAPPPLSYNPIHSPSYPPAAIKQPPPPSPSSKTKKKDKEKGKPALKPLSVIDVMKHQPYQLNSSLFTYGPAAEAAKPPAPKPDPAPPTPPVQNQPIRYEQMAPVQPAGLIHAPYPQQFYGMPPQPLMHDGHYQQAPANAHPPANPYQQAPGGPYQQAYNPQYQQAPPAAYQPKAPQSPNPPYQQLPQAPYQPASSPPYMAAPTVPYQPQPPSSYVAPSFPIAARPESVSGGNTVAAPKPKFTAEKSSAQVWKPTAVDKE